MCLLVNLYLFVLISGLLGQKFLDGTLPSESCYVGFTNGGVTMISTMMQCTIIQMCVLPMYKELSERSPRTFLWVLLVSFSVIALFFAAFGVLGYLTYGP